LEGSAGTGNAVALHVLMPTILEQILQMAITTKSAALSTVPIGSPLTDGMMFLVRKNKH
jgi:hypothetical protein